MRLLILLLVVMLVGCSSAKKMASDWAGGVVIPKPQVIFVADNGTTRPSTSPGVVMASNTQPSTVTPVAAQRDAVEAGQGFTHSAKIVGTMAFMGIDDGNIYFSMSATDWTTKGSPIGNGVGEIHIALKRNGTWRDWKFDHVRSGQHVGSSRAQKDFKNIYDGYLGDFSGAPPEQGETVAFFLINYGHTERSNAIFCEWPSDWRAKHQAVMDEATAAGVPQ